MTNEQELIFDQINELMNEAGRMGVQSIFCASADGKSFSISSVGEDLRFYLSFLHFIWNIGCPSKLLGTDVPSIV